EIRQPADIDVALSGIRRERFDALCVWPTSVLLAHFTKIIDFATQNRLPTIYPVRYFVERGALMSYGANFNAMGGQVASYVDKIVKGARPADLPVEQPTKFELVINGNTAKALGLTIPASILLRADQIIQ